MKFTSKMSRLLVIVALLLTMLLALGITAYAADNESDQIVGSGTWGGIDWTLTTDGTLTIAPTKGEPVPDKNAPTKRTYEVGEWRETVIYKSNGSASAIGGAPYDMKAVKKLIIEEGVTSIGSFTCQFPNLTGTVVIPSTVSYIGQEAFHKTPITELIFAESENAAPKLCIANGAFKKILIEEVVLPTDREEIHIHHWAFGGCSNLKSAFIPASGTKFWGGEHVDYFDNFNSQTNVTWVEHGSIFTGCTKMETITFETEAVRDLFFANGRQSTNEDYIIVAVDLVAYSDLETAIAKSVETGDPIEVVGNEKKAKAAAEALGLELEDDAVTVTVAAKIGDVYYETVQAAIDAAQNGDIVTILPGEYGAINISNKTITIQGTVGANGELLTTIKGGNPAITGHGFNGTIKDLKIVDAFKVMYAEPAGNVTVDNVYVTGATYGFHLVAYAQDLTWEILNSYMDLSWANSFGVYGDGDAAIVIKGNTFKSTSPYYPDYGALAVNTFLPNVTVTENVFGENAKIMVRPSITDISEINISKNYHADGIENAFVDDSAKAYIREYYANADLTGLVSVLAGFGTESDPYQIGSLEDLILFRDSVNAGETKYSKPGVYVVLTADIDLAGVNWVGIGSATADHGFMGNFDGREFKIMNLTIDNPALDSDGYAYAGFFSVTEGIDKDNQNSIKNLWIENVTIDTTGHIVAAAIAYPYYTNVENIKVTGNIAIKGGDYTAGVLAYTRRCVNASNLTVSGNDGSYITGAQTVGGVISDIQMNGGLTATYSNFSVSGLTITGDKNVGGISGIICNQTLNGATVENVALECTDSRVGVVSGSLGGTSTISNATATNVTGATATVGASYDSGYLVVKNGDVYTNVAPVASVNGVKYATLADAIKAAAAGDTITFLADITENVTVSKNLTIDGAGKTYTGAMNLTANKGTVTIKNVNFDGKGYNGYAVETRGVYYLTIEDCTAVNYGYGFVQLASSTVLTTVKNVTVSGMNYGVKIDYSSAVVLENVDITAGVAAVLNSNYGEKTITVKNSKLNIFGTWKRNNTTKTTVVFEGKNTVGQFKTEAALDSFELVADATLTAPEGLAVTTKVADSGVAYENGMYFVKAYVASVNGKGYIYLKDAIAAANAGDTVILLADITESVTVSKNLVIDGAEKNYTGTMTINNVTVTIKNVNFVKGQVYKNKNTGTAANITIKNCDFDGQGLNAYAINLGGTSSIVLVDVTAKDYGYGLLQVPSSCAGLTVKNVTVSGCYYGLKVDYANAVTIENASIDATIGIYDSNYGTKTYTIKNSTISSISIWDRKTSLTTTFKFEGVNEVTTLSTSAYAKYVGVQVGTKIYDSLATAWEVAQDGDTIKLLGDIATSDAITNTKKVTLDLNGKTITGTDNATGSFGLITNKGELTVTGNGKITLVATNNRGWNAYSSVISNTVGGKLIVENGTIEHLGGTDMAYGIDNLTNGKGTYAETVINGGTVKSTYRAIRQFLNGTEADNILTINGGTIEGDNKALFFHDPSKNANTGKLTVGADAVINGDIYLFVTDGSTEWPVEVSIAASALNGEIIRGDYVPEIYQVVKSNGNYVVDEFIAKVGSKYYKSLQAAINAANQYQTVILLQDAEGAGLVINKKATVDFNGHTYTVTAPVAGTNVGIKIDAAGIAVRLINGTLVAGNGVEVLVESNSSLTVQKQTLTVENGTALSVIGGTANVNSAKIKAESGVAFVVAEDAKVVLYTSTTVSGAKNAAAYSGVYYYGSLEKAIANTEEGKTIYLLKAVVVNAGETLTLDKNVTISYTSSIAGEDMFTVRGTLIIDGAKLVYKNTDKTASNVTVSTISCEPGSVLEIMSGSVKNNSANNGAIGIYAYAIDLLTNGSLGDVTATISGGSVYSNYMAIRQFNNGTACKNTLNVTGGTIYGAKRAIQIHMDNNAAYLTVSGGKIEAGEGGYALCLFPKTATNVAVTGGEFIGTVYSGTNGIISGGTFDAPVYEAYIVESYKQVKVDGVYNVIFDELYGSVVTIGDNKYNSLAEAWNAAQDGDTIVLQNNIAIDTETFTVADGKKITLDLNGYTITVTDNATANYELFYIYGEMVVTGKGTIELTSTNNRYWNAMSAIFHNRGGVLTIENGTFTNLGGTDMAWVVDNSGNHYGDAVTNIYDGTLTSTYTAIRNRMEQNTHGASGKAILNVFGGKIDGITSAIWAQAASTSITAPATGEINISGGTIGLINTARAEGAVSMTTITGGTVAGFKGESGELKVDGGKITGTVTIMFANGDVAVKTVIKSKVYYGAVAKIGSKYYATLADAVKACTGAQSVMLIRDIAEAGIVITGKTALDFNGHTYTVTAPVEDTNVGIKIDAAGKAVRLINGKLEAADGSGVEVLVESNSSLTVQKQTLTVKNGTALSVIGGSANLNYATINADGCVAFAVTSGKVVVYTSSKIYGEIDAKKSTSSNYVAK